MSDLLIYCVGYETRSGYIPSRHDASRRIALVFDTHHVHAFKKNLRQAETRNDRLYRLLSTVDIDQSFIQLVNT